METTWNNKDWVIESGDAVDIRAGTVVYIAGPMTGMPDYNRGEFFSAEDFFAQEGASVLNPAKLPIGMPLERYMPICIALVEQADIVALLPGWLASEGAKVERMYAEKQGKRILLLKRVSGNGGNGDEE